MKQEIFALIDINNCYVSCERLFNPALNHKPVVVLSNNDGCVVSRSNEAKDLNIGMAVPWHEVEQQAHLAGVHVFSSNYALYADMSRRFFLLLQQHFQSDDLEPYSIDECFIRLTDYQRQFNLSEYCQQLLKILQQWLGLPCSIGIGFSKTQAKLANHFAKKRAGFQGVCNFTELDPCDIEQLYLTTSVQEVWGIGSRTAKKLSTYSIHTVWDLTFANEHILRRTFSVLIARTIRELKGQSCISLDDPETPSKRILASRSFSQALTDLSQIKQALIFHLNRAHQRLIQQKQLCNCIHISLYEKVPYPPYKKAIESAIGLSYATDDLLQISQNALKQIDVLFKKNIKYVKVSVMFSGLELKAQHISDLWQPLAQIQSREQLLATMQNMKRRYGPDCIQVGYQSKDQVWQMKQQYRSPRYTTCWKELLCIEDISNNTIQVTENK